MFSVWGLACKPGWTVQGSKLWGLLWRLGCNAVVHLDTNACDWAVGESDFKD